MRQCVTYSGVISHITVSCHTYEWVMSHIWMSHVTCEWGNAWNTQARRTGTGSPLGLLFDHGCDAFNGTIMSLTMCATRCNTLQHTATHCNTLQHTATHCKMWLFVDWSWLRCIQWIYHILKNMLQHTATHCNTMQHTVCCSALQCIAVQHAAMPSMALSIMSLTTCATRCNTLQHIATHCNTLQNMIIAAISSIALSCLWHCALCFSMKHLCRVPNEPCILWKEPYVLSKEPCILSK